MPKDNIILISLCCNQEKGSEWDVGWQFLQILLRHYSVHLITDEKDSKAVTRFASEYTGGNLQLYFIRWDDQNQYYNQNIFQRYFSFRRSLREWHAQAYRLAKKLILEYPILFVMKNTPCGFRAAGPYFSLPVPTVWGPISGYINPPKCLILRTSGISLLNKVLLFFRSATNGFVLRFSPAIRAPFLHYDILLASSSSTQEMIQHLFHRESKVIVQSGVSREIIQKTFAVRKPGKPLEIVWCGSIIPRKNLFMVLEILAQPELKDAHWKLKILGTGKDRALVERYCEQAGIMKKCCFLGQYPREKVLEEMRSAHLFLFLSLQDLAPAVISEAFAAGLPVITLNWDGFSHIINDKCGELITIRNKTAAIRESVQKIRFFLDHEEVRQEKAKSALKQADVLSFEGKEEQLIAYLEEKLASLDLQGSIEA